MQNTLKLQHNWKWNDKIMKTAETESISKYL